MNLESYGLALILNEENWFSKFLNFDLKKMQMKIERDTKQIEKFSIFSAINQRQSLKGNKTVRKMISKKSSFGKKLCGNIHLAAKRIGVEIQK